MEGTLANRRGHVQSQSVVSNFFQYSVDKTKLIRERDVLHELPGAQPEVGMAVAGRIPGGYSEELQANGVRHYYRGTQTTGEKAYLCAVVTYNIPH